QRQLIRGIVIDRASLGGGVDGERGIVDVHALFIENGAAHTDGAVAADSVVLRKGTAAHRYCANVKETASRHRGVMGEAIVSDGHEKRVEDAAPQTLQRIVVGESASADGHGRVVVDAPRTVLSRVAGDRAAAETRRAARVGRVLTPDTAAKCRDVI